MANDEKRLTTKAPFGCVAVDQRVVMAEKKIKRKIKNTQTVEGREEVEERMCVCDSLGEQLHVNSLADEWRQRAGRTESEEMG